MPTTRTQETEQEQEQEEDQDGRTHLHSREEHSPDVVDNDVKDKDDHEGSAKKKIRTDANKTDTQVAPIDDAYISCIDLDLWMSLADTIAFWGDAACDFLVEILQNAIRHHDATPVKAPTPLLYTVYRTSFEYLLRLNPELTTLPLCGLADLVVDAACRMDIYDVFLEEAASLPRTIRVSITLRVAWHDVVRTEAALREVGRKAQRKQLQKPPTSGADADADADATTAAAAVASVVVSTFDACFADWYLEFFADKNTDKDTDTRRGLVKCWRLVTSMYNTCVKLLRYLPRNDDLATYVHVIVGAKSRAERRLVDAGVDIPPMTWCSNVACSNLEGDSDLGLRVMRCSCQCSTGCQCTRLYCSDRCSEDAWQEHVTESSF